MKVARIVTISFIVGFLCAGVASALPNAGFDLPPVGNKYQHFPEQGLASWQFGLGDGAGVTGPGSAFTKNNDLSKHGQVAFIQSKGIIATDIFLNRGIYVVTFLAVQRLFQSGTQVISVLIDGIEQGRTTPSNSGMETYATPEFYLPSDRPYRLELRGVGYGDDYTAFIDDVTLVEVQPLIIKNDVTSLSNPAVKCDPSLADFGVNFTPAMDPFRAMLRVRHADKDRIVTYKSWYDPHAHTLFDENREGCARGPYPAPTAPNNLTAQSTFQMAGTGGGAFIRSLDCVDSTNCHFFYGIQQYPGDVMAWVNEGDAVEFSIEIKVPMVRVTHNTGESPPVGQVYVALNASHINDGRTVQFSIMSYETRTIARVNACDQYTGSDGPLSAVIQTTFSPHPAFGICENEKITWVDEQQTSLFVAGGGLPGQGTWSEWRRFTGRLTKDGLQRAIQLANKKQPGFDPNPAHYKIGDIGFITEIIWFDPRNKIEMGVAWRDFEVSVHKAK